MKPFDACIAYGFLLTHLAAATVGISLAGCAPLRQNDISTARLPDTGGGTGIVVGSVTAPPVDQYHDEAYFFYRPANDRLDQVGVMTSGARHPVAVPWLPACDAHGLADHCGRLFALELPAGRYEIFRSRFDRTFVDWQQPATFEVVAGAVSYLGNFDVSYCHGLPGSLRGAILGADISITDQYDRDLPLLRARFDALRGAGIDRQVLPDPAWNYRVSYSPYDWGSCSPD